MRTDANTALFLGSAEKTAVTNYNTLSPYTFFKRILLPLYSTHLKINIKYLYMHVSCHLSEFMKHHSGVWISVGFSFTQIK